MDDRDRTAPVALPGDQPVLELVVGLGPAEALVFDVLDDLRDARRRRRPRQLARIDHLALADVRVGVGLLPARDDDLDR